MDRDLALLQDELNCLRKKFNTYLSTNGGYVNGPTTIPDSSVYPDSNYTDCSCVSVDHLAPSILDACAPTDENTDTPLGDIMNDLGVIELGALFLFDRIDGVRLLREGSSSWENCNTGLSDSGLEHGCVDAFWYKKASPSVERVAIWRVKTGEISRSLNSGLQSWTTRSPSPPSGFTLGQISFIQIVSDPFTIDVFYVLAKTSTKAWILKTTDNGTTWTWLDLTGYNGATTRQPLWMTVGGNGGGLLWVTTFNGTNLTLMKLNNGNPITISAEYSMGASTQFKVDNYFNVGFPFCALDDTSPWVFGRMENPQSMGLTHILKVNNEGLSFTPVTQDWGLDWCGDFKASLADNGARNYYAVRNGR